MVLILGISCFASPFTINKLFFYSNKVAYDISVTTTSAVAK